MSLEVQSVATRITTERYEVLETIGFLYRISSIRAVATNMLTAALATPPEEKSLILPPRPVVDQPTPERQLVIGLEYVAGRYLQARAANLEVTSPRLARYLLEGAIDTADQEDPAIGRLLAIRALHESAKRRGLKKDWPSSSGGTKRTP